jgi:hypothetical protein
MGSRAATTNALSRRIVILQRHSKTATILSIWYDSTLLMVGYSNNILQVMNATEANRKGLYRNKNIQKVVNAMWFAKKQDEGVVYYEYFKPFPDVTFSLVLTGVRPFLWHF